jgi:glycosyltransferase involved in cell wall biosynthesis
VRIIQALGWYYPDSLGGTEVYVAGLCRRLRAAGHEVFVAVPDVVYDYERFYEHDGIPVYRYPIPNTPTRAECQGIVSVQGAERFHAWLARQHPDVVHIHTFVTGLSLAEVRAAKVTGARVIVTTHSSSLGYVCQRGTMMRWGERLCDGICRPNKCAACELHHRGLSKPLAWVVGGIPPRVGRILGALPGKLGTVLGMSDLIVRNQSMQCEMVILVDKFVLLTEWALEAVAANSAPRDKLALNRLGLSQVNIAKKANPTDRPTKSPITIGYLGRFDAIKGVYDLARAVAHLPRDVPIHIEFRGPVNSDAERRVEVELRAIVEDDLRVTFAPSVPEAAVLDVLAGYDVLCCPAVCLEGGPTVALEAYAVGTPVIGTRIGGLAEIIMDGVNGKLIDPGDWRALAELLQEMAYNPAGTIDHWRWALPAPRTMDQVAADYLAVYIAQESDDLNHTTGDSYTLHPDYTENTR